MKSSEQRSNKRRNAGTILTAVVLVVLGIGVFFYARAAYQSRFVSFDNYDGTSSSLDIGVIESARLLNVSTEATETVSFQKADYTLLVLLAGGDCPNCLAERKYWAELGRTYEGGKLHIVGVMSRTSPNEAKSFTKGLDLPFTVFLDAENKIASSTPMPVTPFKVLLKNGKPVFAEGPAGDPKTQQAFFERIKEELDRK